MPSTVIGIFDVREDAENATAQLVSNGFNRSNIDISAGVSEDIDRKERDGNETEKENGILHFFKSLFSSDDDEAERFSAVGSKSGAIVTVHAQSTEEAEKAADLLDDLGALDVNEKANEYQQTGGSSFGNMDAGADYTINPAVSGTATAIANDVVYTNTDANIDTDTNTDSVIPIVQESLEVGKKTVQTGGVRVRSRIVERPVAESIRLREEFVQVERTPVNRVVTDADFATFQDKSIELTETAEVPVVSKEARVVEEIKVKKGATEREETIHDTVRNTEVDIEDIEGTNGTDTDRKSMNNSL